MTSRSVIYSVASKDWVAPTRRIIDTEVLMAQASRTPGLLRTMHRWCRLNGIEPSDVPVPSEMVIEDSAYGLVIRHEVYLLDAAGRRYLDPEQQDRVAIAERTALLRIAPPVEWTSVEEEPS
ncbi:hypothetical protein ABZX77_05825 [Streptomyces sp. NPDC004237]|uniref:hypothetical protein n=1 Tax=Streptomyces sp. NPDC004237 TaxID=3154455 RepID=UPI0033AF0351